MTNGPPAKQCASCQYFRVEAIEMRTAVPADAAIVADYHERCFRATYSMQLLAGDFGVPDHEGTLRQLQQWFRPESSFETQVVVVDAIPIGHFTILGHQLVHLFVEPEHQGRGLGTHMLATAEATMHAAGHIELELHARVENLAAIGFYRASGWTVTDRLLHTVEHGIDYHEHVIVKHLR